MESNCQEKIEIKTFHGMCKVVADRVGVTSDYVGKIIRGDRATKSDKAQKVIQEAKKFNDLLK